MRNSFILIGFLILFQSCKSDRIKMDETFISNPNGFPSGFCIQAINVQKFDSSGLPKYYTDSTLRVDLIYSGSDKPLNKIWLYRPNKGYYWTMFDKRYDTMPLKFDQNVWYHVWSNDWKMGIFKTNQHSFFLYRDKTGVHIFDNVRELNFL